MLRFDLWSGRLCSFSCLGLIFCDNDGTRDLPERGFERYGLFTSPDKTRRKITIHKLHQNPLFS